MSTEVTAPLPPAGLTAYVAAELRAQLARDNISRSELARRLGKDDTWVGKRLNGRTEIRLSDLERVAAAIGYSPQHFLPRDGRGNTRRYPGSAVDPLAARLVATVGEPFDQGKPPHGRRAQTRRAGRGARAVRLARPGIASRRRPVTPAVR